MSQMKVRSLRVSDAADGMANSLQILLPANCNHTSPAALFPSDENNKTTNLATEVTRKATLNPKARQTPTLIRTRIRMA